MTEQRQIYKCKVCGDMIEVLISGRGHLVCCDQSMELLSEKSEDVGQEKHVPVIERTETGIKVKVGSVPHPMEENHLIQWIEVTADGIVYRKYLIPGDKPEAEFEIKAENIEAREFCNLHGLLKS